MADRGKVIKGLECCSQSDTYSRKSCKECPYNNEWRDDQMIAHLCQITQLRKDALFLMKSQEPQEVQDIIGTAVSAMGKCPACGVELNTSFLAQQKRTRFCYNCGQAVKWND